MLRRTLIASAVLFGLILTVVLMGKMFNRVPINYLNTTAATTNGESTQETPAVPSGRAGILFMCYDSEKKLTLAGTVTADMDSKRFSVRMFDCSKRNADEMSLSDTYYTGGEAAVLAQAKAEADMKIDRYISVSEWNFTKVVKNFKDIEIDVEQSVSYSKDEVNLLLKKGLQKISYINLLNYMKYGAQGDALPALQAKTVISMLKSYISEKNLENGEELFGKVINLVKSDIGARDFIGSASALKFIAQNNFEFVYEGIIN